MISLLLAAAISWPVRYNDGVTAYHSNDFNSAAATFEQATASPDRSLQQRAFYNLGNTVYRLGEADPTKAQALWDRAIKSYEAALALDPKDEDTKFNHEFVKKKLEELKKQQEQQQQQKQEQEKKQKNTGGEAKQSQPDQQQNQQGQQPESQPEQKHPNRGRETEQPEQEQQQQAQPQPTGNLDKQQAKALLDNLREDERNWNFFPEVQMKDLKDAGEPAKDW